MLELEAYIREIYMRDVYYDLHPTAEQRADKAWINDTYIVKAVEECNVYKKWIQEERITYGAETILEMINNINIWYYDNFGEPWKCKHYSVEKVVNMYAYVYVKKIGIAYWIEKHIEWDEEPKVPVCESSFLETNETDERCPICLEEYDRYERQQDGICNSDCESDCPHWGCVNCWKKMWEQHNDIDECPICRRDITNWLKTHYDSE
jgi:hypothetical protein